jgi:hypothetical protein
MLKADARDTECKPEKPKPLRATVYRKLLTREEQDVILAMLEAGDSSGQNLRLRVDRIATWAKMSKKSVQRVLWGDHRNHPGFVSAKRNTTGRDDDKCPFCKGLIQRRVLQQVTPPSRNRKRPAEYSLHLELLDDDPKVAAYIAQRNLPLETTSEQDIEKWINHNMGRWKRIQSELQLAAEARVGAQPLTERQANHFAIQTAAQLGMPIHLARKLWDL